MINLKKRFIFKLITIVLYLSILNAFSRPIYLPTISININSEDDYIELQLKSPGFTIFNYFSNKRKSNDSFYNLSIQNIRNNKGTTLWDNVLLGSGLWAIFSYAHAHNNWAAHQFDTEEERIGYKSGDFWSMFLIGGIYGIPGSSILMSGFNPNAGVDFVESEYKIKNNLQEQNYLNIKLKQKQSIVLYENVYTPPLINTTNNKGQRVKIASDKINLNTLINLMIEPKKIKKYKKIFIEVEEYNSSSPDFNKIIKWRTVELEKYGKPKGEFEKTNDYKKRVIYETEVIQKINAEYESKEIAILKTFNDTKEKRFDDLIDKLNKFEGIYRLHKIELSNYNADKETFTVTSPTHFLEQKIGVKLKDAPNFKEKYLNALVIRQTLKPLFSTKSKNEVGWNQGEETILINLKTNKHIPFLSEDSNFKYSIEEN